MVLAVGNDGAAEVKPQPQPQFAFATARTRHNSHAPHLERNLLVRVRLGVREGCALQRQLQYSVQPCTFLCSSEPNQAPNASQELIRILSSLVGGIPGQCRENIKRQAMSALQRKCGCSDGFRRRFGGGRHCWAKGSSSPTAKRQ